KGVDLPMLLIITGVIGGLIGFGIIGLFIGPVILAVTFTLLRAWILRGESVSETAVTEHKAGES
ncbi:MAG TPA: AI-2E family transporter YdiK, partial [Verrucomicrobiae bacterium]